MKVFLHSSSAFQSILAKVFQKNTCKITKYKRITPVFKNKYIGGSKPGVMVERYAKNSKFSKNLHIAANNLGSWFMSQPLPYKNFQFTHTGELKAILELDDYAKIGYFGDVDLKYADETEESTKFLQLYPETEKLTFTISLHT